jgi:thiosulfate/3-mercaptopyruvate sulfurtransferase
MEPMVSTQELAASLGQPELKIIDASYAMPGSGRDLEAEFQAGHIPGAVRLHVDEIGDPDTPLPHMLPVPVRFEAYVGAAGIRNRDTVVIYDTFNIAMAAARMWWTFRVMGHERVFVLDGGFPKWKVEGRPIETGAARRVRNAAYAANPRPHLVRLLSHIKRNLQSREEQVVDARARERWEGTAAEPWPARRQGRIPGSLNLPFNGLIAADGTLASGDVLAAKIKEAGIDPTKPVVSSCGSGVTASVLPLAFARLNYPDVAVYDGSWAEWGLPENTPGERPIETGPTQRPDA